MRRFVIALAMFACVLALPVPHPRELMQLEKAPAAPDAANQYGSQLVKPIIDGVGKRNFMFASVTRENTLDLFKRLANGDTGFVVGCLAGGSELACGVIQFYIIMIGSAVAIPIICGFFTCCFLMCRCCPCCKSKLCCYNCGGKQPRNKKTETGEWVSGPYTRCEKMCWYTSHAIVIAILLLLSIGGAFSVNSIPSSIGVIIDALVFVMEIPGKFFDVVATPAIATAIVSMNDKVSGINTNYSTAATAVKTKAADLATNCNDGTCCTTAENTEYGAISNLAALSMTFDPNAFSGFLNKTLNDQLKEGKDVIKTAMSQSTVDMIKGSKSQVLLVPATAGFVLFVPVFLPIIINLLAFICRKQCPFWCSHICAFLFSGLVFLIFILVFLVGSILTEMCVFLPAVTINQPDVSGLDAVFPLKADGNSSAVPNLFKQCFAKKTGGNMFLAVNYDISGQIHSIVTSSISNEKLGLDSAALAKLVPISQADRVDRAACSSSPNKVKLQALRDAQLLLKSVTDNIETSTRAGVTTVLTNFANQISSCDDLATGYLGLRNSICEGFSDSIVATYFSLYGCGIFLILFLLTTCKIVKKVSRGGTVAPGQAPQVAGAPDAASSMTKTKQPNTDAHVTKTADPKGKTK